MWKFEVELSRSNLLNPFSDLSYGQQSWLWIPAYVDPYKSEEENSREEARVAKRVLFDSLWNDYFKVLKKVNGKSCKLNIDIQLRGKWWL